MKIDRGVSELWSVENLPLPLTWPMAYTTDCIAGCDDIPAWLLRSCSFELADVVAYVLNCSFSTVTVPSCWLNALVTPVPKVPAPVCLSV